MAQKLDKHYSDFGGIDTRSNKMKQSPSTFRDGSKNWRYTLDDELAKRYGFHHRTGLGNGCEYGLFEYQYKDINTGEVKSKVLGVNDSGVLSTLEKSRLKLSVTAACSAYYYSFYYDGTNYVFKFYDSTSTVIDTVTVSTTDSLDTVKTAINALAISGLTADVVDADGTSISSSEYAYHIDVVYLKEFDKSGTDYEYCDVHYWSAVPCPYDTNGIFYYEVVTKDFVNNKDWCGFTTINLNNSLYICSGLFVYKYDGASVYRSGAPDLSRFNPAGFTNTTGGSYSTGASYAYGFQLCFCDHNGVVVKSPISYTQLYTDYSIVYQTGYTAYSCTISGLQSTSFEPNRQFPIYSCTVNGQQTNTYSSTFSLTVDSGHNIKAGMCLRIHGFALYAGDTPGVGYYGRMLHYYAPVSAVTATTITLDMSGSQEWIADPTDPHKTLDTSSDDIIWDNLVINGCYVPDYVSGNTIYENRDGATAMTPSTVYGAFMRILRTDDAGSVFYHMIDAPIPHDSASGYTFKDAGSSTNLVPYDSGECAEPPRACSIINKWQGQLIQGGRALESSSIVSTELYPNYFSSYSILRYGVFDWSYYQESDYCDFNSVYWTKPDSPEGFPQDGLYEDEFINNFADQVKGIISTKEAMFVFKDRTTAYVTGTLSTGDTVKEYLEGDVGSVNQNCLQIVRGGIMFLDKFTGFWICVPGRLPEHIGWPISNLFQNNEFNSRDDYLRLNRAVSCNYRLDNQYLCYVPAGKKEDGETTNIPDPTSSSKLFVFDYSEQGSGNRSAWIVWQGINAAGGIVSTTKDQLFLAEKTGSDSRIWSQKRSGSVYDYSDHTSAIETNCKSAFINEGLPMVKKHWSKCWIASISGNFTLRVDQYFNYLDTIVSSVNVTFIANSSTKKDVKNFINLNNNATSSVSIGFYHNTINEDVRIPGWEIGFAFEFDTGETVK